MPIGAARSPPTSLWWALVTLVILTRRGSCKRLSVGRCGGGGGAIGGEIAPPPPTQVVFNTARTEGHKNSDMWNAWRRDDCRDDNEESLQARHKVGGYKSRPAAATYGSSGRPGAKHRPGMTGSSQA